MNKLDFSLEKATDLIIKKVEQWIEDFVQLLPNLLIASLVMLAFIFLAKYSRIGIKRLMKRFSGYSSMTSLASSIVYFGVIIFGILTCLSILQLDKTVTSLLAGAGFIGLALSFAFQNTATNFMAGIILAWNGPFKSGDIIKTNDYFGKIQRIGLRTSEIETFQGLTVVIPNKEIIENTLVNYTHTDFRRVDLLVGISYGDNLREVKDIVLKAVSDLPFVRKDRKVLVHWEEFGDSSINFYVRFWIVYTTEINYLEAKSEAIMVIKEAFDENDITIPFPIRTLDFGIKGGERLVESMQEIGIGDQKTP